MDPPNSARGGADKGERRGGWRGAPGGGHWEASKTGGTMPLGKRFETELVPEWRRQCVNYKVRALQAPVRVDRGTGPGHAATGLLELTGEVHVGTRS